MADVTHAIMNVSMPIKLGWIMWMIWLTGQAMWYRRATVVARASSHQWPASRKPQRTPVASRPLLRRREPERPLSVTRPPDAHDLLPEITAI